MIAMRVMVAGLIVSTGLMQAQVDIAGYIPKFQQKWAVGLPDFRGSGGAEAVVGTFNAAIRAELEDSGVLTVVDRSLYPLNVPQTLQDFKRPSPWLTEWSNPPASATHLVFGYAGVQDGRLALFGWLLNLSRPDPATANVFGKVYFGDLDKEGAKKVAHEFAADILQSFGVRSLNGTKIYFVSDRSGKKEIWSMDYDGSNQRQLTAFGTITQSPAVSQDGKWLAYSTLEEKPLHHRIMLQSTETGIKTPFAGPEASITGWPEFTPDGQRLLFASSITGNTQIYSANLKGGDRRQITNSKAIDFSPKVNPKTGVEVLFISDRSGKQQLWRMNIDGGDPEMLTNGAGEVANPSWSPDGQLIAFAWTQGFEIGGFNIFVMDVAKREPAQLTKDGGVNENPWWAPDGLHVVFTSKRNGTTQIFTVLADGTRVHALTTQGNNYQPVWANLLQ
jgi:TolB protein